MMELDASLDVYEYDSGEGLYPPPVPYINPRLVEPDGESE